jgi:hypothetical protein
MRRTLSGSYEVTSRSTTGVAWKTDRSMSGHMVNINQGSGPPGDPDTLTIKPYGLGDDLGRKAVARVAGEVGLHTASLAQPPHSGQSRRT